MISIIYYWDVYVHGHSPRTTKFCNCWSLQDIFHHGPSFRTYIYISSKYFDMLRIKHLTADPVYVYLTFWGWPWVFTVDILPPGTVGPSAGAVPTTKLDFIYKFLWLFTGDAYQYTIRSRDWYHTLLIQGIKMTHSKGAPDRRSLLSS